MLRSLTPLGTLALALAFALGACQQGVPAAQASGTADAAATPSGPPTPKAAGSLPPLEAAFKGWELYAWEAEGQWRYSLVVGTNAIKPTEAIVAPSDTTALVGEAALIAQLERLPKGEEIFWNAREGQGPTFGRPPEAQQQAIAQAALRLGLVLHLN